MQWVLAAILAISCGAYIYPAYMHAEVGALIAEHEFGLKDRDALNAIKYHCSGRPDMSMLEKIIFFSDYAESHRPNPALLRDLYQIAKTDIDEAIMRSLFERINYQMSHHVPAAICELSNNIHDYLLGERFARDKSVREEDCHTELLSDKEFDRALEVVKRNGIAIDSVQNIRRIFQLLLEAEGTVLFHLYEWKGQNGCPCRHPSLCVRLYERRYHQRL